MKRKNLTRISAFAVIFAIMLTALTPICALAYEGEAQNDTYESNTDATVYESEAADPSAEEKDDSASIFDTLYLAFEENVSEIMSLLAFLGSLVLMLCYKKGFLPLVTDGIKALGSGVKSIGERTDSLVSGTEALSTVITERLKSAEDVLEKMKDTLTSLEGKLGEAEANKTALSDFNTVLSAEVDMLYEIFMAASMPQYLKDSVGERVAAMRSALAKEVSRDEKN